MKRTLVYSWLALGLSAALSGCASEPQRTDVWDTYDVRYPVPPQSQVPVAYYPFIDNDAYYAAPDCSVMDSPGCMSD